MAKQTDRHALRREHSVERLMEAALKILSRKHYGEIRIEDIAGEAGMAKGSLYMYFSGKEELYIKTMDKYFFEDFGRVLDSIIKRRDSKSALRDLVNFSFDIGSISENIEIFYRAVMDKPLLALIHHKLESYLNRYLALVERHFSAIGAENPSQRAFAMFALLDSLYIYRFLRLAGNRHWETPEAVESLKSEVLRVLGLE